jgi:hypothetical protein
LGFKLQAIFTTMMMFSVLFMLAINPYPFSLKVNFP